MILWCLLTYGITLIVTSSKIFRFLRESDPTGLLRCPMCTAWWVGLVMSLQAHLGPGFDLIGRHAMLLGFSEPLAIALANAFCASGWCWFVHVLLVSLGSDKL